MPYEVNVKQKTKGDRVQRRHALVVGVGAYDDPELTLTFSAADAALMSDVLAARGFAVTALHDGLDEARRPTLAHVRAAIADLAAVADEDDVVVVYFTCHGRLVKGRPHMLLADTPKDDALLPRRGLPLAAVLKSLLRPKWVAVFLDACHMGLGLDPGCTKSTAENARRGGGFALLSGSDGDGITQDTGDGGIFSKVLVDGLIGGAAAPDGRVQFTQLARHVQAGLERWRESKEGALKLSAQRPVLRLEVADVELLPPVDYVPLTPRQPGTIRAAAFSPDGRRLATACDDGSVRLWDPGRGLAIRGPMRPGDQATCVAFSPDGGVLLSGCHDGTCTGWGVGALDDAGPTGPAADKLGSLAHAGAPAHAVAWSRDGARWAAATSAGLHVYRTDPAKLGRSGRRLDGHDGAVTAIAFLPDGRLVSGGIDGTVRIWDVGHGTCVATLVADGPVAAVAVSPDGRSIAAAGLDEPAQDALLNVPRVWDVASGELAGMLIGHTAGVTAIAFDPGGARLATAGLDGCPRIWDLASGACVDELVPDLGGRPPLAAHAVAFAPAGQRLFVGHADGSGRLYDVSSGRRPNPPAPPAPDPGDG